jgi:hypothetical protein
LNTFNKNKIFRRKQMKRRIFTLALVVLFALTLVPLVASADENLIKLGTPVGIDAPDSHWGWSNAARLDHHELPQNMRGITGIRIEFDIEPGQVEFIVQSPADWWDHPGATEVDGNILEIVFEDFTENEEWDLHNKQYEMHLVFGNWDDTVTPANIVNAWLIGEDYGAPQFEPGDEDPVLAAPSGIDAPDSHWGWSMINGSLPWNMSEITGIIVEFDFEPGQVEFVVQSPAPGTGWWDHPGATAFDGNTLEITFADWTDNWDLHIEQNEMHIVFGNWDGNVTAANVVSAQLIGTVAEGIPNPEAGEVREIPPEGTLPFFMGLGEYIWGDPVGQIGWNGDTRAVAEGDPFAGDGGLSSRLLVDANFFVIYVDNAPDDYEYEMLRLGIFGTANGWSWSGGGFDAPTVQIYDADLGAIVFPIAGHPYMEDIRAADESELDSRNFAIYFQYGIDDPLGSIADLGITGVWLYADRPEGGAAPEPPAPEPVPEPPAPPPAPEPTPPAATDEGFPWWGWALIVVGVAAVVVVIVVVVKKKK